MGWQCKIGEHELSEEALTAAQWASVWTLCNLALPHTETQIGPSHCPICRNVLVAAALAGDEPDRIALCLEDVASMRRDVVLDAFTFEVVAAPTVPDEDSDTESFVPITAADFSR